MPLLYLGLCSLFCCCLYTPARMPPMLEVPAIPEIQLFNYAPFRRVIYGSVRKCMDRCGINWKMQTFLTVSNRVVCINAAPHVVIRCLRCRGPDMMLCKRLRPAGLSARPRRIWRRDAVVGCPFRLLSGRLQSDDRQWGG